MVDKTKKIDRELSQKAHKTGLKWAERWVKKETVDRTSWEHFKEEVEEDAFQSLVEILSSNSEKEAAENLQLWKLEGELPAVQIPFPRGNPQLPVWRLPLAAALGVFLGLLIFGPLLGLAGISQQEIVLITGMGGAFLTTGAINYLVRSPRGRNLMLVIAGVGGVTAAATKIMGLIPGWGGFWRLISGRKGSRAFLLFPLAAFLALISRPRLIYPDYKEVAETIETALSSWMKMLFFAGRTLPRPGTTGGSEKKHWLPEEVIRAAYKIHEAPPDELETACEELIQEIKKAGFEGFIDQPAFLGGEKGSEGKTLRWSEDFREQYDSFGEVQEGERVRIEDPVIVFKGEVIKKGMVRKIPGKRRG